jgi:PHD/YefM family antitoxin component YafN of YafNO toxin-antitoxin module
MYKLPQMTSIAELRNNHLHVFGLLAKGPVVINSRSLPVGVLVSPQMWNHLIERLEDQQDVIDALSAKLARLEGKTEMMTQSEIETWLADVEPAPLEQELPKNETETAEGEQDPTGREVERVPA